MPIGIFEVGGWGLEDAGWHLEVPSLEVEAAKLGLGAILMVLRDVSR
jgi:hypothetical protein